MNFLELVQKTVRKSGAKVAVPSTVVGQTGLSALFVEWVQDAWKDIQLERLGLNWRVDRNLSLALVASTYEYSIPATLESLNTSSLTCHLATVNETKIYFRRYRYYQREVDRQVRMDGKPQFFTIAPDDEKLIFWPNPDEAYTIDYEGIKVVEELDATDTAGVGTSDALVPSGVRAIYHDAIMWQAMLSYAMHFEDGTKLSEAQSKFLPYKKYFEERYMEIPSVNTSAMYTVYQ